MKERLALVVATCARRALCYLAVAALAFACRWAWGDGGPEGIVRERFGMVEVNHCYGSDGKHAFDQLVFYDWIAAGPVWANDSWQYVGTRGQLEWRYIAGEYVNVWQPTVVDMPRERLIERSGSWRVRDWRYIRSGQELPHWDWNAREYVSLWVDVGVVRDIRTGIVQETWTQHDPDAEERKEWPRNFRRGLHTP